MDVDEVTIRKTMPSSLESERAIRGAILPDETALSTAAELMTADDFQDERNRRIFRAMLALAEDEKPIRVIRLRSPGRSFLTGWRAECR